VIPFSDPYIIIKKKLNFQFQESHPHPSFS
jgi:hypothetical protein